MTLLSVFRFSFCASAFLLLAACGHEEVVVEQEPVYTGNQIYPGTNGMDRGFEQLGMDMSNGAVDIFPAQGGPSRIMRKSGPFDGVPVDADIPVNDTSVTIYDVSGNKTVPMGAPMPLTYEAQPVQNTNNQEQPARPFLTAP